MHRPTHRQYVKRSQTSHQLNATVRTVDIYLRQCSRCKEITPKRTIIWPVKSLTEFPDSRALRKCLQLAEEGCLPGFWSSNTGGIGAQNNVIFQSMLRLFSGTRMVLRHVCTGRHMVEKLPVINALTCVCCFFCMFSSLLQVASCVSGASR